MRGAAMVPLAKRFMVCISKTGICGCKERTVLRTADSSIAGGIEVRKTIVPIPRASVHKENNKWDQPTNLEETAWRYRPSHMMLVKNCRSCGYKLWGCRSLV